MVGSKSRRSTTYTDESTGETFYYDDDNTGYSGYSIKSYNGRNGIYETLKETNCLSQEPDIVILQIGTNNIIDNHDKYENSKDLDTLINYILQNIPSKSMLFVATILNIDPNNDDEIADKDLLVVFHGAAPFLSSFRRDGLRRDAYDTSSSPMAVIFMISALPWRSR